jgi:hypothetical protein
MRIIIEDTEQKSFSASANTGTGGAYAPGRSTNSSGQMDFTAGATDAGGPPQELLQALQNDSATSNRTFSSSAGDAGAAPTD